MDSAQFPPEFFSDAYYYSNQMLQNINFQNISVELKPSGRSPGQPAVGGPA